jgi:Zn finger protein HypA/HybF involved in hydrogenase expression
MTKYCIDCRNVFIAKSDNVACPECQSENITITWDEEN